MNYAWRVSTKFDICVMLDELHIGQNNYSLVMYTNLRQICYNEGIA